ncbi:hypothetical protein BDZ94DRAFT_1303030, partial [Collybia nuda]
MGRPWTTPDQKSWLELRIPEFLEAQKSGRTDRFHQLTSEAWFQTWPESIVDNTDSDSRTAQVTKKKKQLRNWFFWNSQPTKRMRSTKSSVFLDALKKPAKSTRVPRPVEAYQRLYKSKTRLAISTALKAAGKITKSHRLNIIKSVPADMLSAENPEVLAAVTEYVELEKEKRAGGGLGETMELGPMGSNVRTPAQVNRAIQEFPLAAHSFLESVAAETGWIIHLVAAGPNPAANGEIASIEQYFGPRSVAGNTFQQAHAGYEQHVERPFLSHVQGIFPLALRKQRALYGLNMCHEPTDSAELDPSRLNTNSLIPLDKTQDDSQATLPRNTTVAPPTPAPPGDQRTSLSTTNTPLTNEYGTPDLDALFKDLDTHFGTFSDAGGSAALGSRGMQPSSALAIPDILLPEPPLSPPLPTGTDHVPSFHSSPPTTLYSAEKQALPVTCHSTDVSPAAIPIINQSDSGFIDYTVRGTPNNVVDITNTAIGTSPAKRQDTSKKRAVTIACKKTSHTKVAAVRQKSSKRGASQVEETISTSRPRRKIQPPPRADRTPSPPPGAKEANSYV